MNRDITLRIALDVILGVSIFFGWWFIAIPIAFLGAWMFPYFLELLVFAFIHDMVVSAGTGHGIFDFLYIIGATIILGICSFTKVAIRD